MKTPAETLRLMGVDPAAEKVTWIDTSDELDTLMDERDVTMRPWKRADMPDLAEWLGRNAAALRLATEASARPRWWVPARSDGKILIETAGSGLWRNVRAVSIALQARAMLRFGEGDEAGAWDDLLSCERLAGLVSRSPDLPGALVAANIHLATLQSTWPLIEQGALTPGTLRRIDDVLREPLALPSRGEWILQSDRYQALMQVGFIARTMQQAWNENRERLRDQYIAAGFRLPDWNQVLRKINAACDLLQADERSMGPNELAAHRERLAEIDRQTTAVRRDSNMEMRPDATMDTAWLLPRVGESQDGYTGRVSLAIMSLTLSPSERLRNRFASCHEAVAFTRLAVALVQHKHATGAYPQDLASPALAAVSARLSPSSLRYERVGAGFRLSLESSKGSAPVLPDRLDIHRER